MAALAPDDVAGSQQPHMNHEPMVPIKPDEISGGLLEVDRSGILAKRLIIAVDFGTTYSAVSYATLNEGELAESLGLDRIESIQNYPGNPHQDSGSMKYEVPTQLIYPRSRHFRENRGLGPANFENADPIGDNLPQDNDPMEVDEDQEDFSEAISQSERCKDSVQWGYAVNKAWSTPDNHSDKSNRALARFKLLLDGSEATQAVRTELGPTIAQLQARKIVSKGAVGVIADYLTCLLGHTKFELEAEGIMHGDSHQVEMVLCVPALWSSKACRYMQTAMAIAMKRTEFAGVDIHNNSIENLFIVSEPEAAAAYVLANDTRARLRPHDTFVLLDAGGGTVDANTYRVTQAEPLRLELEVAIPGGGLHGSSYLNEAFRGVLRKRLDSEKYLEQGETTLDGIVEMVASNEFEFREKKDFIVDKPTLELPKFYVSTALRDDVRRGFRGGSVLIKNLTMQEIFMPCLKGVGDVMEQQITAARAKGTNVLVRETSHLTLSVPAGQGRRIATYNLKQKVILIGGFARSKSLQNYLDRRLREFCADNDCQVELIKSEHNVTAVASGAVLRALNKNRGPRRYARSSYGILRSEPWGQFPEHYGQKKTWDNVDGEHYVKSTIDWVLKKGDEVDSSWEFEFVCRHTFPCHPPPKKLLCEEVLWVSDSSTESHYQKNHPKNQDAEKVGEILADFTFLRDQNRIQPIEAPLNRLGQRLGRKHYEVKYTMRLKVVDRDLTCYAIYENQIRQKCRINIASAFSPGVK